MLVKFSRIFKILSKPSLILSIWSLIFSANALLSFYLSKLKNRKNNLWLFFGITFIICYCSIAYYRVYLRVFPPNNHITDFLLYDLELEDELAIYIWYSFIFAIFLTLDVIAMLLYFRKQNMVVSVCIIFEILPLELMITYYSTNPAVMKFNWFMFTNIVWTLYTGIILVLKPLLMLQHFFRLLCGACEKFISQRRGQFFVFFPNIRPRIKFLFKTMVFTAMVFPIPILYYRQMSICAPYRRQIFHFWAKNHGFFDDMVFAPDRENYDFSKFSFRKDCRKDLIIEEKVEESTVKYHVADCMVGDLDIILQAKKNVEHKFEAENYNVFTKNSIDYSDAVYEEYRRLEKEKSEKKTDK